jgi:hypothetical protein
MSSRGRFQPVATLRGVLTEAALEARRKRRGLWRQDRSRSGLEVDEQDDLEQRGVIFPKLFRRLTDFLGERDRSLAGFLPWLAATEEQVLGLRTDNFTHFDNVVRVEGNTLKLIRRSDELVFVSAKTTSPAIAPWVAV